MPVLAAGPEEEGRTSRLGVFTNFENRWAGRLSTIFHGIRKVEFLEGGFRQITSTFPVRPVISIPLNPGRSLAGSENR